MRGQWEDSNYATMLPQFTFFKKIIIVLYLLLYTYIYMQIGNKFICQSSLVT